MPREFVDLAYSKQNTRRTNGQVTGRVDGVDQADRSSGINGARGSELVAARARCVALKWQALTLPHAGYHHLIQRLLAGLLMEVSLR
jgi:hypothetical protein